MKRSIVFLLVAGMALAPALVSTARAASPTIRFSIRLTGSAEPRHGAPHGKGTAAITLQEASPQICFAIRVSGIRLPARAAEIHVSRTRRTGRLIVRLRPPDKRGRAQGCVSVPRGQIEAIKGHPAYYYLNITTVDYPRGAIRGTL